MSVGEIAGCCGDPWQVGGVYDGYDERQQGPVAGQDVVAAAAEHGKDGVAERAFRWAAR